MPVIILGGIYSGIFTPTEAAAVSVVYGLFVGMVVYREIRFKELKEVLVQSIEQSATIMFILACATLFAWVCTTCGISRAAANWLQSVCSNQFEFLLVVNIILLIAGCFIDANSAMYIFIPIMLPVVKALGYDPIAFGVVMTVNLAIGLSTPPVGVDLFVACQVGGVNMKQISKAVVPMLIAQTAVLLLITYVPSIITWLPNVLS
jgi:C4-dicarboxylate transporter DctM subunit